MKFRPLSERIDIKIFPNPVATELSVTDNTKVNVIKIYNTLGGLVKTFDYEVGARYYVGDLARGVYLVQFSDAKNEVVTTKRMKKE